MSQVLLYMRLQYKLFLSLHFFCVLPLFLIYQFSPYPFDNLYFLFLALLLCLRIILFKDDTYLASLKKSVPTALASELGRVPSSSEIVVRVKAHLDSREYIFMIPGVLILVVAIIFGKL